MRESAGSPPSGCWCQPCAIRTSISSERVFRLFSFINCRVGGSSGWGWKSRKATKQRALLSRVARCAWQEFPDVYRCFAMLIGKSDFNRQQSRHVASHVLSLKVYLRFFPCVPCSKWQSARETRGKLFASSARASQGSTTRTYPAHKWRLIESDWFRLNICFQLIKIDCVRCGRIR